MNRPSVSGGLDPEGLVEGAVRRPDVEVGVRGRAAVLAPWSTMLSAYPLADVDEVLALPAFRDVPENHDDADELPVLAPDRGGTVVDGELAPVPGDEQRVVGEAADEPRVDDLPHRLLGGLSGLFVDDAEDVFQVFPEGLGRRPSGERLGDGVHVGDEAVGVGGQDRVADGGERHLIPRGGPGARPRRPPVLGLDST